MSHKYLSNVQESKTFLTSNEIQIKNIGELALVLKEHGNTIYTNHVNENTNDKFRGESNIAVPHSKKIYANLYVDDKSPGSIDYFINHYEKEKEEFLSTLR